MTNQKDFFEVNLEKKDFNLRQGQHRKFNFNNFINLAILKTTHRVKGENK